MARLGIRYRPIAFALVALGSLTALATVAGYGGKILWLLDLFSHFRAQYLAILVIVTILLLLHRQRAFAAVFSIFALINFFHVVPYYVGESRGAGAPSLRVVSLNVNAWNDDFRKALEFLDGSDADVIALVEPHYGWLRYLAPLRRTFPHELTVPRSDGMGIALFSRLPFSATKVHNFASAGNPSLEVALDLNGLSFTVIATHAFAPTSPAAAAKRDAQLSAIATHVSTIQGPAIVLGDFNTTPWSTSFTSFLRHSKLRNSARGYGLQPTWPTWFLPFQIPIDHCLISDEVQVVQRVVGPDVGSDHYPLTVELALAEKLVAGAAPGTASAPPVPDSLLTTTQSGL